MTPRKIEALESLAREMVGDDKTPDLFFVTDGGAVVTITRDFQTAYTHWQILARRYPLEECALENRCTGVLASVEPETDEPGAKLIRINDTHLLAWRKSA